MQLYTLRKPSTTWGFGKPFAMPPTFIELHREFSDVDDIPPRERTKYQWWQWFNLGNQIKDRFFHLKYRRDGEGQLVFPFVKFIPYSP